ncbi:carbohydrate ABC transporter substrate-binding protein, CUT1 family [Selenomonas ruminantium]|uniref:Carbohydrate ABC transporter substrate-binding protein, CUT1 family n=2 Tax=Selenomonas TaxID=970 RepID=A0A1I3HNS9_SELRU|nr:sugar ABC transporter substrate-binding protein [Selenomonas ruminantium]SFI37341.1 carbohydrate ABC transporter substrate-binding protein, CUT1 family [Selenomonas ruminantium]
MRGDVKRQLLLLAVALLLLLAGMLAYQQQKTVELRVGVFAGSNWDVPDGDSYAVVEAAIKRFEAKHPGVKVTYVSGIKKEDYSEWLAEKLLAGEEPDVFVVPGTDFNMYAAMGALQDLSDFGNQDKQFSWDVYYPAALDYGRYDGRAYGLPVTSVPTLMFVNKTLLAREGIAIPGNDWTWQDFLEICRRVTKDTDGDGVLDQFGFYDYDWKLAVVTNGVELFREDGRASYFASSRMEEAVQFLLQLHNAQRGREVTAKDFDMGRVAFRPFTFAEYRTYKPYPWRIKKYSSFEWDCIKLPAGPSGDNVSNLQTMLMGMSAKSGHRELAWLLLKEICYAPESQQLMLTKTQGLPSRRDVVEADTSQALFAANAPGCEEMNLRVVSEVMERAVMQPRFKGYDEAMLRANNELQQVITGIVPFNNSLNKLQKEINAYLQQ